MEEICRHLCLIYKGAPSVHLPVVAAAAADRLAANFRCLYLNSPPMVAGFRTYLAAAGIDIADATERGALVLSSDQEHLIDGEFDGERMLARLAGAVEEALADGYAGLWATGDMLWEFGSPKNFDNLLAYEVGLEELLRMQPALSGICQYHRDMLPATAVQVGLYTHRAVYINEILCQLNPHYHETSVLRVDPDGEAAIGRTLADLARLAQL